MKEKSKRMSSKILSLFLAIMMLVSVMPAGMISAKAASLSRIQFEEKLSQARKKYPSGTYAFAELKKREDGRTAKQCLAYAHWLSWFVWGIGNINGYNHGKGDWTVIGGGSKSFSINSFHIGDVCRFNNGDYDHSIFITDIVGNKVYFTDCNGEGDNRIRWDEYYFKEALYDKIKLVTNDKDDEGSAPYGYVAHYKYNTLGTIAPKITIKDESNITNNGAQLCFSFNQKFDVDRIGVFYATDANRGALSSVTANTERKSTNKYNYYGLWHNETSVKAADFPNKKASLFPLKNLEPKTKYHYKIMVRVNGEWYISKAQSFWTKHDKPNSIKKINLNKGLVYALGDTATATWEKAKNADFYKIYLYKPSGEEVVKNVNSTNYITPALNKSGKYTIKIVASNAFGDSDEMTMFALVLITTTVLWAFRIFMLNTAKTPKHPLLPKDRATPSVVGKKTARNTGRKPI